MAVPARRPPKPDLAIRLQPAPLNQLAAAPTSDITPSAIPIADVMTPLTSSLPSDRTLGILSPIMSPIALSTPAQNLSLA